MPQEYHKPVRHTYTGRLFNGESADTKVKRANSWLLTLLKERMGHAR